MNTQRRNCTPIKFLIEGWNDNLKHGIEADFGGYLFTNSA